jgi:hypothetical protein
MRYIDLLIRFIAAVSLIPLALLTIFLAIMSGDSPHSGPLPFLIVLAAGGAVTCLIGASCITPDALAARLERYVPYARYIVRVPAYLFAPFGLYFGSRLILGIHV